MNKATDKKKKLPRGFYNLEKLGCSNERADELIVVSKFLARIDSFVDIFERMKILFEKFINLESQRLEMNMRESMNRIVSRAEQQELYKRVLADPNVRKVVLNKKKK